MYYDNLGQAKRTEQTRLATVMYEKNGVPTDRSSNYNDLPTFEALLNVRIAVISSWAGNWFIRVPTPTDKLFV